MATAVVELTIPILLLLARFRARGVVLALAFHFVLALDPVGHVWDFAATLLPLFLLFGSQSLLAEIDRWTGRLAERPATERLLLVGLLLAAGAVTVAGGGPLPGWIVAYPLWLTIGGGAMVLAAMSLRGGRGDSEVAPDEGPAAVRYDHVGWRPSPLLIPVVLLTVAVGLSPHLQLRSAAAFNMYSNLAIGPNGSNHLLIELPAIGGRAPFVEIVEVAPGSALAYYLGRDLLVPGENLTRHLADHPAEWALVRIATDPAGVVGSAGATGSVGAPGSMGDPGSDVLYAGAISPPAAGSVWSAELDRGLAGWLKHKFAYRRAQDGTGAHRCLREWGPVG